MCPSLLPDGTLSASDAICPSCGIQFGYDNARPEPNHRAGSQENKPKIKARYPCAHWTSEAIEWFGVVR